MAETDVLTPADSHMNPGDLRRLRKGDRGAGPRFAAHIDNPDKDVTSAKAVIAIARRNEQKATPSGKAKAKAEREDAEAALEAEVAKPDTVEVTGA